MRESENNVSCVKGLQVFEPARYTTSVREIRFSNPEWQAMDKQYSFVQSDEAPHWFRLIEQ